MNQSLDGLKVLVTRPAHQQQSFIDLLKSCSATPISFPLSKISLNNNINTKFNLDFIKQQFDFILFVSPNAVNFTHQLFPFPWENLKAQIICVGNTSKKSLLNLGQTVDLVPSTGFNSEHVIAMDELKLLNNKHIAIFGGNISRPLLKNTFEERGATVEHIITYTNTCPIYTEEQIISIFKQNTPDVLCITSNQGILNLINTLDKGILEHVKAIPLIVNSHRCKHLARKEGFHANIIIAEVPGDLGQLTSLQQWYSQQ